MGIFSFIISKWQQTQRWDSDIPSLNLKNSKNLVNKSA